MFEIILLGISYIQDIPMELMEKALKSGILTTGCILGIKAQPVDMPDKKVDLELQLQKEGQEKLMKIGQILPLNEGHGTLHLHSSWRDYFGKNVRRTTGCKGVCLAKKPVKTLKMTPRPLP